MTKIKLHGDLADQLGRSEWDLCVDSPNEALWAINSKTNQKLHKILIEIELTALTKIIQLDKPG